MGKEIQALKAFHNSKPNDASIVPKVMSYGMFNNIVEGKKNLYSFYVMPKYGKDIEQYFQFQKKKLSLQSIIALGIKVIDMLEMVHNSGYIYGDLKLDNILIGDGQTLPKDTGNGIKSDNCFQNVSLNLIDFGFATKFLDKQGNHNPETHMDLFQGNLIFSSIGQLSFRSTSRRDDLISLAYMISYLLHEGHLLGFDPEVPQKQMECYNDILSRKKAASCEDLCGQHTFLLAFFEEIFQLGYDDTPDYFWLRF